MTDINNVVLEQDDAFTKRGVRIEEGCIYRCSENVFLKMKYNAYINGIFNIMEVGSNAPRNTFWKRIKKLFHKLESQEVLWHDITFKKIQ